MPLPLKISAVRHKTLFVPCLLSMILSSCDSEKKAALSLLSEREVDVSSESLFSAIEGNDFEVAKALITAEAEVDARDEQSKTALMLSAGGEVSSLVPILIEQGADVNAVDEKGLTALSYAVNSNRLDNVVDLLENGASPSVSLESGGTLIGEALREKQIAAARLLLKAGADPNSVDAQNTPLMRLAVERNYAFFVKDLVERGVTLNDSQEGKDSLLHLALNSGQNEMLVYLLEQGMDPNTKNADGEGLVHVVTKNSTPKLLSTLHQYGTSLNSLNPAGWSPLHLAILARDNDSLEKLLDLKADVNQVSNQGNDSQTPLSLAISNDLFPTAQLLLDHGAVAGNELYRAVKRGGDDGLKLVDMILKSGASPEPSGAPESDFPLNAAVRAGDFLIAQRLLEAGASQNTPGRSGQKPFHIAVAMGDEKLVELFLDNGADVNETFNAQVSEEFLGLIKTKGVARWALTNSEGIYPIMIASDSGNIKVAQLLMAHGADTTLTSRVKRSRMWPLTFASRRSDTDMMQVILGREPGKSNVWMRVDLSKQRAYVFKGEEQVYSTRVSTGKSGHRTRKGKFVITNKYRDWTSTLYDSSMPYFQRLSSSDFGFHVGYVPSYPASHGCIRMPHSAAKKLFGMTKVGDYVEIVQ